jgi:phage-related protein
MPIAGNRPLVWLQGEVKTPPFSRDAQIEAGFLLRRVQHGENVEFPASRPMPDIGPHCHELRIDDGDLTWRIAYHIDSEAIVCLKRRAERLRSMFSIRANGVCVVTSGS